jgi:uncharacterized phage protein gp47/JayE
MSRRVRSRPCGSERPLTPEDVHNRPALSELGYRVGRFATFREEMLRSVAEASALDDWTTRASEDRGIALIEMWAYLADVLVFYQERYANEAFVHTAEHRDTLRRLARLIGYEPAPGLAAETMVVFEAEEGAAVDVPVGLRLQSEPGEGESPQRYETVEPVGVLAELNGPPAVPPPEPVTHLEAGDGGAPLDPDRGEEIAEALSEDDPLLMVREGDGGSGGLERRRVDAVRTTRDGRHVLRWNRTLDGGDAAGGRVFSYRRTLRLFGHDAPSTYLVSVDGDSAAAAGDPAPRVKRLPETDEQRWIRTCVDDSACRLPLDGEHEDVSPGDRLLVDAVRSDGSPRRRIVVVRETGTVSRRLPDEDCEGTVVSPALEATVTELEVRPEDGSGLTGLDELDPRRTTLYLLREPEVKLWRGEVDGGLHVPDAFDEGARSVFVPVRGVADRISSGRRVVLTGDGGPLEATVSAAEQVPAGGRVYLRLELEVRAEDGDDGLAGLDPSTARVRGNAARATHGETVADEVLGDGDASQAFQRFAVSEPPVTHVPDPEAPGGARSTLTVRVEGVEWEEADALYGRGGSAEIYTTSPTDDEGLEVRFGDGEMGRRLPSGRANVRATYRTGLGREGNVATGAIGTLLDRPEGLEEVRNPVPAEQGTDPESGDEIRSNAPGSVRTFGRVVSLRDFEDAARRVVGIAKARAAWHWAKERGERVVRVVAVGEDATSIEGDLEKRLEGRLDEQRAPHQPLRVVPHRRVCVSVEVSVQPEPDRVAQRVLDRAERALKRRLAFERMELGEAVRPSDLYQVLDRVEGVRATRIDAFGLERPGDADCGGGGTAVRPAALDDRDLLELDLGGLTLEAREIAGTRGEAAR